MRKVVKSVNHSKKQGKPLKKQMRPAKKAHWPKRGSYAAGTLSLPLATELMRSQEAIPALQNRTVLLEAGVLAFRRETHGATRILLISKKRTKKWGIPKGKLSPHLPFTETAAKEAFEEAGVIGSISPSSVGMFRAKKSTIDPPLTQIIEVWVYLLEVTQTLRKWPEKGKRATRWVTCEEAASRLREPVLARLCHRLAQG
jgi:8-oxo-dGTP pyrophosphatase MutT (NUDIX family)